MRDPDFWPLSRCVLVALVLVAPAPGLTAAGPARTYEVRLEGAPAGEARLALVEAPDGTRTLRLSSTLVSSRDGVSVRRLSEEVVSRDGRFVSGRARLEAGGTARTVDAVRVEGAVEVRRDGRVVRLPLPDGEAPWAVLDASRDLALRGAPGDRRLVFDPGTATLGHVVLLARDEDGVLTEELGVRVRTVWREADPLPRALLLPDAGLAYHARDARAGPDAGLPGGSMAAQALDPTSRPVAVAGRLVPGARVRLEPEDAFRGLDCPGGEGRIAPAGPVCPEAAEPVLASAPMAGPNVRALVAAAPAELDGEARAAWLAAEIARRLDSPPAGASLWEDDPEAALAAGAGDCNEATAVFMAAAPLLELIARRRTGLVLDPDDPARLWPHAWVEVRLDDRWVRVDPERGEAPARGLYVDLGDGSAPTGRLRPVAAARLGARVVVLD